MPDRLNVDMPTPSDSPATSVCNPSNPIRSYFTRSKVALEHKAAGVLPFCFVDGIALVLLGAESSRSAGPSSSSRKILWRDFGGLREAIDEDVEATASREFAEESLGLFASSAVDAAGVALSGEAMAAQLRDRRHVLHIIHRLRRGAYSMFIALVPYLDPLMLHLATQQNAQTRAVQGAEKTAFAWVRLDALLAVTRHCAASYQLRCWANASGDALGRRPVSRGRRCLHLHPCFASSLRMARKGGLGELIAAARKTLPLVKVPVATLLAPVLPPACPLAEGEQRGSEHTLSCSPVRKASKEEGAAAASSSTALLEDRRGGGQTTGTTDGSPAAATHASCTLGERGCLPMEEACSRTAAEAECIDCAAVPEDISRRPACTAADLPRPGCREETLFDLSPEWRRALQSLAQIPSLGVFAKRLKRTSTKGAGMASAE